MNIAELLDKVFDIYKNSILHQILWIVAILISSFVFIFVTIIAVALIFPNSSYVPILIIIVFLVLFLVSLILTGNLLLSKQSFSNKKSDLKPVFRAAFIPSLRALTAYVAILIITLPPVLALAAIIYFLLDYAYGLYLIPLIISIVALVLFILFISCTTYCAIPSAVYEKKLFFGAIKRSFKLTKGNRFRIILIILFWNVISFTVNISLNLLAALLYQLLSFTNIYSPILSLVTEGFATIAAYFLLVPFSGILLSVIYHNQRIKNEGFNLALKLQAGDKE